MTPAELDAALARLRDLESNFTAAVEREKLAALYQLAYGLSHEINNPLANISSRAQTLLLDEKDPERRRRLAVINAQAFRAHEMIADLMLFAKPPKLDKRQADLAALLRQIAGEMQPQADEQRTALLLTLADQPQFVSIDAVQIAEAVKAVVKNGLEAIGEGGRIEISVEAATHNDDSVVAIVIRDTGPGIPPEVRRHIFDPYFSGREAGRGLGLGLSKCWRIVDLHGGRIDVANGASGGAEFRLVLPRGL
jgi:signal transduction histidine kinase